jgi:hypothetical protein
MTMQSRVVIAMTMQYPQVVIASKAKQSAFCASATAHRAVAVTASPRSPRRSAPRDDDSIPARCRCDDDAIPPLRHCDDDSIPPLRHCDDDSIPPRCRCDDDAIPPLRHCEQSEAICFLRLSHCSSRRCGHGQPKIATSLRSSWQPSAISAASARRHSRFGSGADLVDRRSAAILVRRIVDQARRVASLDRRRAANQHFVDALVVAVDDFEAAVDGFDDLA